MSRFQRSPEKKKNNKLDNKKHHKSRAVNNVQYNSNLSKIRRAVGRISSASSDDICTLQRVIGNRAVSNLVQAQFEAGFTGDFNDHKAGKAAEVLIKRKTGAGMPVSRASELVSDLNANGEFANGLVDSRTGGSPLSLQLRRELEPKLGADFSSIRIHTGRKAAQLSRSIQARAFTHGRDIYFAEGQYSPTTPSGKHLLAHELTHTMQQSSVMRLSLDRKAKNNMREVNIPQLLGQGIFLKPFKNYAESEYSKENIDCYVDIAKYKKKPSKNEAKRIYETYIAPQSPMEVNIGSEQEKVKKKLTGTGIYSDPGEEKETNFFLRLLDSFFNRNEETEDARENEQKLSNTYDETLQRLEVNMIDTFTRFVLQEEGKKVMNKQGYGL